MSQSAVRVRRAARRHVCASCDRFIEVGEKYLWHTLFPKNDIMDIVRPVNSAECSDCARRYGREIAA